MIDQHDPIDCHGGPGTTQDACGGCITCLHRIIEGLESERDALQSWKDSAMAVEREWDAQPWLEKGGEMSDTPRTNALICAPNGNYFSASAEDFRNLCRQLEIENKALQARVTSLQRLLDQRWEMMRELEEVCETKDVAKAVEYVKGLKARVKRLEDAGDILESDKRALKAILSDLGVVGSMGLGSTLKWIAAKEPKP